MAEDLQGVEFPPIFNHLINNRVINRVITYIISKHQVVYLCSVLMPND